MKSFITVLLFGVSLAVSAQHRYYVAVSGKDTQDGSESRPFRTIGCAAEVAQPGDVITVHAGTYREWVRPPRGGTSAAQRITYQAAPGEDVTIKGSEVVRGWIKTGGGAWRLALPHAFFGDYNPYKDLVFGDWFFPGRNRVHTGEVYLDGKPLGEAANVTAPLTWSTADAADSTLIFADFGSADPNERLVEINVRPACFYPVKTGIDYITVKGFHMSQAATQWAAPTAEQVGLIGTNWSKGWIIEDNVISDSKCAGITLGKDRASGQNVWFKDRSIDGAVHYNNVVKKVIEESWSKATIGSHTVRRNKIYRCGQAGICGSFGAAFSTISDNDIWDIYTYRNFWGAEMAGIKLHAGIDAVIKDNRIHNCQKGIWLDWMTQGTRVSSNLLYDNDFVDLFVEVSHGPYLVDNNLFLSGYNLKDLSEGGAFVHNLFTGLISRSPDSRTTPYFLPHSTQLVALKPIRGGDDRFINNIFIGKEGRNYFSATYPAVLPDEIDSLAGYGLALYKDAAMKVTASGNTYLAGAYPLPDEQNAAALYGTRCRIALDTSGGGTTLQLTCPEPVQKTVPVVTTPMLSKATVPGQDYTNPDNTDLKIDRDYFGNRRGRNTFPGPFAVFFGRGPAKAWPKKEGIPFR